MNASASNDVVLRVTELGITLAHTGRSLLQGCSFELRAGERLTLIGESGAGKSLLAQAIMGLMASAPGLFAPSTVTLATCPQHTGRRTPSEGSRIGEQHPR